MTERINMIDLDVAVALAKAARDTLESEQAETVSSFDASIAQLQEQINTCREQLARLEVELDALALGGLSLKQE
jgi:predicted  nucleic acid-binding Zn-ribbon protein